MTKKKNGTKKALKKSSISTGKDGRIYFTVYVTKEQHEVLRAYGERIGIGVGTLMRNKAMEAATAK